MFPLKKFNIDSFLDVAETLLRSDDTLLALEFLERFLPGYYRDHYPKQLLDLKREVMAKLATTTFYATHKGFELTVTDDFCENMKNTLRGIFISADIKLLNENGFTPHVYDHGPGEGALPLHLQKEGLKFTYEQAYVNHPTYEATKHRFEKIEKPRDLNQPTIWVSTEVVEHLHCEKEIRFEMEQRCGKADIVHISTPLYTFNPNVESWRDIGWLGHLRTYTPKEFQQMLISLFPDYHWVYYQSQVQHGRLFNPDSKFDCIKVNLQLDQKTGP